MHIPREIWPEPSVLLVLMAMVAAITLTMVFAR